MLEGYILQRTTDDCLHRYGGKFLYYFAHAQYFQALGNRTSMRPRHVLYGQSLFLQLEIGLRSNTQALQLSRGTARMSS